MTIESDFSVSTNGNIRYIGSGSTYYTVLELHRYLQNLADNASTSGDDLLDITSGESSDRSTDNIITLISPYNIDYDAAEQLYDGSITQTAGAEIFSGLVVVGAVETGTELIIIQDDVVITSWWATGINADAANNILLRTLIQTRTGGADVDGKRIRVMARELGDTYAEFGVTMGLGNSTAAIFTSPDLNNTTEQAVIATWTGITNVEGYQTIDLNNGNGPQPYYSQWNKDIYTINQLYERTKWIQRRGTAETIHGISAAGFRGISHEFAYDNELIGEPAEDEEFAWGTGATAGIGLLLALKDDGDTGTMWIQLLSGVAPTDGMTLTGGTSTATVDVAGTVTGRTVNPEFLGQSTGSAIIGAFGIGIESADLTVTDKIFDLFNVQQSPPNNQTFTISGLVNAEDRIIVAQNDGSDEIDYDQLTLATSLNSSGQVAVIVTTAIPNDTPPTGTIRVQLNTGVYRYIEYTSWTGSTFTTASTDWTAPLDATQPRNVFISYIDKIASGTTATFTAVYSTDRSLVVKVRDGGGTPIKPFKTPSTFNAGGGGVTAIRTSDA